MYTVDIPVVFFHRDVPCLFLDQLDVPAGSLFQHKAKMDETSCGYKASITKAGCFGWRVMLESEGKVVEIPWNPLKSRHFLGTFFGTHGALLAERNVHRKRVVAALWRSHI